MQIPWISGGPPYSVASPSRLRVWSFSSSRWMLKSDGRLRRRTAKTIYLSRLKQSRTPNFDYGGRARPCHGTPSGSAEEWRPRTATQYTGLALSGSCGSATSFCGYSPKPIIIPLKNLAVQVVKSPGIRGESASRRGFLPIYALLAVAILHVANVVGLIGGNRCANVERCRCASTTSIFPFRLASVRKR